MHDSLAAPGLFAVDQSYVRSVSRAIFFFWMIEFISCKYKYKYSGERNLFSCMYKCNYETFGVQQQRVLQVYIFPNLAWFALFGLF